MNILTKFGSNYSSGFREDDYNKQHTFWHFWASCFFCVLLIIKKKQHWLLNEPSNEHSYQVCFQLAQQFQRRPLKQHTFSNIWAFCFFCVLFINKKNHSLLNEPSNEHSYQVCFQLAHKFQRKQLKHTFWHI
jgi:hypothetical protein